MEKIKNLDVEEMLKRYREFLLALEFYDMSGRRHDKFYHTTKGYAWALYNQLKKLGIEIEPPP